MSTRLTIREIDKSEYQRLGELTVAVYSKLDGFPSAEEQPEYYERLSNIGTLNQQKHTKVLVALTEQNELVGGVVYYSDMSMYGSGGTATQELNASGIRLLSVDTSFRSMGIGKALTQECIKLAKLDGNNQVILHTTQAMKTAWGLYEKLGFKPSSDLDFSQQGFPVFGFRLLISD